MTGAVQLPLRFTRSTGGLNGDFPVLSNSSTYSSSIFVDSGNSSTKITSTPTMQSDTV